MIARIQSLLMNDGDQDSYTTVNSIMTLSVPHLQGVVVNRHP